MFPCVLVGPEYGRTHLLARLPFVITEPGAAVPDNLRAYIPAGKRITWSEDATAVAVLDKACREKFGTAPTQLHLAGVRFSEKTLRFRGIPLHLTPNEKRILLLLLVCRGTYFTAGEITALCLRTAYEDAAAVHICNLNAKAVQAAAHRLIECRRYKGYRIPTEPKRDWMQTIV